MKGKSKFPSSGWEAKIKKKIHIERDFNSERKSRRRRDGQVRGERSGGTEGRK